MSVVTQKQIANVVGVSQSSVKAVFSPDPRIRLRPETRDRILTAARRMGYVPHRAAQRLARSRSHSRTNNFDQIGLIYLLPEIDGVCLEMTHGIDQELSKLDASLTFMRLSHERHWEKIESLARAGMIDGWLLYGAVNDGIVERLQSNNLPHVILGDHRCTLPVHCVNVDNATVGRMAAEHLAALGHRRIAFFGGGDWHQYETRTLAGFLAAAKELKLDLDEQLIWGTSCWERWHHDEPLWSLHNAGLQLDWIRRGAPTAIFTAELNWAECLGRVLMQSRISVPRDMSILGYETISIAAKNQGFTRIELPFNEVGRQGVLMLHRLAGGSHNDFGEMKIAPSLVEGWSTERCRETIREESGHA
jgi:DNA-binding LacI/PurR family transcriptional regulator